MSMTPDGPDYLDSSGPVEAAPDDDNRKRLIVLGAIVAGGAVIAGGAWAASSFFATGSQPAEALPDSTVAYFSVDLDPSGGQKIEAIKTLRKFPGFNDKINLETDDDLRERLFEEITKSGGCKGLDYAKDVKPWLGSRAAMAAVDLGEDTPAPVGVVQVTDGDKAEDGMATLLETCDPAGEGSTGTEPAEGTGGWVVDGDWLVIAETEEIAQQVVDATDDGTLAADSSFDQWTGEAGDDGFMSFYVSKAAADLIADQPDLFDGLAEGQRQFQPSGPLPGTEEADQFRELLKDFDGAAATVRFDDGAVEIEYAMSNYQPDMTKYMESGEGVDMVAGLPDDTVAALGFSMKEGWADAMLDYVKKNMPAEDVDSEISQFEEQTGLAFPEDLETLLGEGVTISLGSGIDPDAITNGGPGEVPAGIKVKGDADEIQAVLDKISAQFGPEAAELMQVTEGDGYAVLSPQDDYRSKLESSGDLGGNDDYAKVIEGDDAQAVLFVNFDADDNWLARLTDDMPEVSDNVEPLSAFGVSGWVDDDVMHGMFKLTTD